MTGPELGSVLGSPTAQQLFVPGHDTELSTGNGLS